MKKSGKIVHAAAIAREFGYTDINGERHLHPFSLKYALTVSGHSTLAAMIPEFMILPNWMMASAFHHFH